MQDFLLGTAYTCLYIIALFIPALLIRKFTNIGREAFRKLLHCIALGSILCYVYAFPRWHLAVLFCLSFALLAYPLLKFLESFPFYARLMNERKKGEVKNSLIVVFLMFAIVLSLCWGYWGDKLLAVASVFAWGFGDAAAALVGQRWGRHKIPGSKKSWEGSFSMFALSLISVFAVLMVRGGLSWSACFLTAFVTAFVSAAAELFTPGGYDTITCPLSAMAVLLPMVHILEETL